MFNVDEFLFSLLLGSMLFGLYKFAYSYKEPSPSTKDVLIDKMNETNNEDVTNE